jgi:uncharacterized protein YbaR (Trm112 family)
MFIELVDSLRCLNAHEDTWLVAAVARLDGRHIAEGTLGCPVCRREYPIRDGVGWFVEPSSAPDASRLTPHAPPAPDDRVTRAAALLGLMDAGGIIVLGGDWADCADAIAELGPAHVVILNRSATSDAPQSVSSLVVGDRLPFAAASVRAAALDAELAAALSSAAHVLRSRGRLVAPADAPVPDGVTELARDAENWVAERAVVASPPVMLRSARR